MKRSTGYISLLFFFLLLLTGCASHRPEIEIEEADHEPSPQALEHFIRGVVLDQQGELIRAIAEYRRALLYDSTSASIHLAMAEDYYALKLLDDALNQLYVAQNLEPKNEEVLKFLGDIYIRSNQLDSTAVYLEKLVEHCPDNFDYRHDLASIYLRLNRTDDAVSQYKLILEQHPEDAEALGQLNALYISSGSYEEALGTALKLYKIDDQDDRVCFTIASLYAELDQTAEADSFFALAAELNPNDPRYYTNWAFLHLRNDAPDRAAEILVDGTYQHPTSADIWGLLGSAYQQAQQDSLALEALDVSLELDAGNVGSYITLGFIYDSRGEIEKAIEVYEQALTIAPENALILNNYAYLLSQKGERLDEALSMAQKAVQLSPDNPSYLDTIGWVYFIMGQPEEGREYIERALELDPENATILEHLGDLYSKLGEHSRARDFWLKALEYDPDNVPIREKLAQ